MKTATVRFLAASILAAALWPAATASAQTLPFREVCLVDVSKTVCELKAFKGDCIIEECFTPDGRFCLVAKCNPQFVRGLIFSNPEPCIGPFPGTVTGQCDCWFLPDDAKFVWQPNIKLRLQESFPGCPYRGIWGKVDGVFSKWFILDTSVFPPRRLATGTGHGTLGVGSHRDAPECNLPGCEPCYIVVPLFDAAGQIIGIQVHIEGVLLGEIRELPFDPIHPPCRVQVMMRGEMRIPFGADGQLAAPSTNLPWEAEFTLDGELCCVCDARVGTTCTSLPAGP